MVLESVVKADGTGAEGNDKLSMVIMVTETMTSRPRRLAILFWFIRRKYLW